MSGRVPFTDIKLCVTAVCHTCKLRHKIEAGPHRIFAEGLDWEHKHPEKRGCVVEFVCTERRIPKGLDDLLWMRSGVAPQYMEYGENTNFNFSYRASAAITNAIASLATSATFIAGYESAIIDNSSNKDLDILISALVTVGTTPTVNTQINIYSVSMLDDSTWPDVFDGTTSAETVTSAGILGNICLPLAYLSVDSTTSNRGYPMTKRSLASLYGGTCPDKSALFTAHNSGVNLNSTGGNHVFSQQSAYLVGV